MMEEMSVTTERIVEILPIKGFSILTGIISLM